MIETTYGELQDWTCVCADERRPFHMSNKYLIADGSAQWIGRMKRNWIRNMSSHTHTEATYATTPIVAKRDDQTCSKHLVIPQEKMQQISYFSHALCSVAVVFYRDPFARGAARAECANILAHVRQATSVAVYKSKPARRVGIEASAPLRD